MSLELQVCYIETVGGESQLPVTINFYTESVTKVAEQTRRFNQILMEKIHEACEEFESTQLHPTLTIFLKEAPP